MKFNRNSDIFIQENAFETVVCEMTTILSRPQSVKQCLKEVGRSAVGSFLADNRVKDWKQSSLLTRF